MRERLRMLTWNMVFFVLPFVAVFVIALLAGCLLPRWLSIPTSIGLAVLSAIYAFYMGLDEDDWWNDFRGQNRILILSGVASIAAPALGCALGYAL